MNLLKWCGMKTIHKYPIGTREKINLPKGAEVLHVGEQGNRVMLWCMVDTTQPTEERVFTVFRTGWNIERTPHPKHVGSVVMPDGLVWHVFEEGGAA